MRVWSEGGWSDGKVSVAMNCFFGGEERGREGGEGVVYPALSRALSLSRPLSVRLVGFCCCDGWIGLSVGYARR